MAKNKTTIWVGVIAVLGVLAGFIVSTLVGTSMSTIDGVDPTTGLPLGTWSDKLVNYKLIVSDKYTGADLNATFKVYGTQPTDWNNPRGYFDKAVEFTTYTSTDGSSLINRNKPGTFYVVATATGYNTEFFTITIPDGAGRGDLSEYQSNPDAKSVEFALIGATTDEDITFTLTNATNKELKGTVLLTIDENTELRGWKVVVSDDLEFGTDADGNGVYDEGISMFKLSVGSKTYTVFEPARGTDEFDSRGEFTFMLEDIVISGKELPIRVEIRANTGDYIGAHDEVLGEGEGVVSYIKVFDAQGNLFSTTDITA